MKIKNLVWGMVLLLAVLLCFSGCEKEKIVYVEVEGEAGSGDEKENNDDIKSDGNLVYVTISASNEINNSKSRTQIGENNKIYWQKDDELSVFYAIEGEGNTVLINSKFTTTDDNVPVADFSGNVDAGYSGTQFLALYPYDPAAEVVKDNSELYKVTLKSSVNPTQTLPYDGGYDPKACPTVAILEKTANGSYKGNFKPLCGMIGLKFNLADNRTALSSPLQQVKVSLVDPNAQNHFHLSGNYSVDISGYTPGIMEFATRESHDVIVKVDGGNSFNVNGKTEYLISIPPVTIPAGVDLKIYLMLEDGRKCRLSLNDFKIDRAKIISYDVFLSDENFKVPSALIIETKDEFIEWYNSEEANEYDMVTLATNIDFGENETFKTRKFSGVFDGGGYTIKGMTVTQSSDKYLGFIGELSGGSVMNLTLEDFTATDEADRILAYSAGLVAYMKNGAVVSNCKIINSEITSSVSGGIAGKAENGKIIACEVRNCIIEGGKFTGGLVGELLSGNNIVASYTHGTEYNGVQGGIVGLASGSGINNIISCYSTMDLKGVELQGGIYGEYGGFDALNVDASSYAGPTTIKDRITTEELKGKMQEMNSAITEAGYDYQYTAATEDAEKLPLVITAKAE